MVIAVWMYNWKQRPAPGLDRVLFGLVGCVRCTCHRNIRSDTDSLRFQNVIHSIPDNGSSHKRCNGNQEHLESTGQAINREHPGLYRRLGNSGKNSVGHRDSDRNLQPKDMSERLNAPARSPLRRTHAVGKDSPTRAKKSPIRFAPKKVLEAEKIVDDLLDPEADALRLQAENIEHELNHLTPALQRFWQVAPYLT